MAKANFPILRQSALATSQRVAPYLTPSEVQLLSDVASNDGRESLRNGLLIVTLFQTGLRISEALSLTPASIQKFEGKPVLSVVGKGRKLRQVSCPQSLADKLKSYAYERKIEPTERLFPINRTRGMADYQGNLFEGRVQQTAVPAPLQAFGCD